MFHNKYEPALIDEYGMALTPGTENFISLSYTRVSCHTLSNVAIRCHALSYVVIRCHESPWVNTILKFLVFEK